MYLKTDGIVLRETEYKDNDKLLTLLTRENGQLTAKARGVKSRTSKLRAGCQLLTLSEFTLLDYQGKCFFYMFHMYLHHNHSPMHVLQIISHPCFGI